MNFNASQTTHSHDVHHVEGRNNYPYTINHPRTTKHAARHIQEELGHFQKLHLYEVFHPFEGKQDSHTNDVKPGHQLPASKILTSPG
jgi:hypothetical protein